ncbi:Uncharacterised protein [Vibrio cholerae]|nr:Uncharacterised protein [Vibrio cholerae]
MLPSTDGCTDQRFDFFILTREFIERFLQQAIFDLIAFTLIHHHRHVLL